MSNTFCAFADKLLIRLRSNLVSQLIMGSPGLINFWSCSVESQLWLPPLWYIKHPKQGTFVQWCLVLTPTWWILNMEMNMKFNSVDYIICSSGSSFANRHPLWLIMMDAAVSITEGLVVMMDNAGSIMVTPYGNIDLGQHWFRKWLVAWRHQAITWTNVEFSSVSFCGIHLQTVFQEGPTSL